MASRTERDRVLLGGMQLLDPADKLSPGNSLILKNFRPDTGDQLQSRDGSFKTASNIGSGTFHTLKSSDGFGGYLAGIGPGLYGPDSNLAMTVDSGYDGETMGVAYYQNCAWVMNRKRQSRILGNRTRERWGVPAPVTAPTATGGGQLSTLIEEYDDTVDLSVGVDSPPSGSDPFTDYALKDGTVVTNATVAADTDTANYRSGTGSLRIAISAETSVTAYVSLGTADLRVDGKDQDGDVIRVWVFASNPALVDRVTVYARTKARTEANHGYVEYSFDASKYLNQALSSWTQLKITRRLNLDDWSQRIAQAVQDGDQQTVSDVEAQFATAILAPTFVYTGTGWPQTGIGSPAPATFPPSREMLNLDWGNISEFGVTFKVNAAVNVGVDRAEVIGTVGQDSSGAIQYFVSFENEDDQDGNPSPASNSVVAGNQTITLTTIPVSGDSNIVARRIYRIGGGLSQPYLVGRLAGNASTGPWVDTTSNAQAQADNIVMPADHDLPPPARFVIGPFFGKLIALCSDAHPARYWWTPSAQPWFFPGALDDLEGNWEDAGGDSEPNLTATDHKQSLWIYKNKSIWRISGDPQTTDPIKTNALVGAVGPKAVVNAGSIDYFVGREGVYSFNGDFEQKISTALDPIFKGRQIEVNDGEFIPAVNASALDQISIVLIGDRLRISYANGLSSVPNTVLVCHLPTLRWQLETFDGLAAPAFTALLYDGKNLLGGATSGGGYLYQIEAQGFDDDGAAIQFDWQSRFHDQDLPDCQKVYTEVEIEFASFFFGVPNSPLTISLVLDNGFVYSLGTVISTNPTHPRTTVSLKVLNGSDLGRRGKNAAIQVTGSTHGKVWIYGMYLHWYAEERIARSFDTGPSDCGIPERVKEVDFVEFYMTAQGQQLSKVISSDLPGSVLTVRDSQQFAAPNGRGNARFRLNTSIDGRNFRMFLSDAPSGTTFQVHQARARMRVIGEYIDGTIPATATTLAEYFETPEFSIAPGRVGELKDLLLDYDSTGGDGILEIYADLPGNALTRVRQIVLPAQARTPRMFPLELPDVAGANATNALPYGQLFRVRVYPPLGGIVRLHGRATFRARVIGVYFDGTRGEIWETQPLDLLGGMSVFREIRLVAQAEGSMSLDFRTELPGQKMATVATFTVNPSATTAGRLPFIGRLPGNTKGTLQQVRVRGSYVTRILEASVFARRTQTPDTGFEWIPIPLEVTPDAWMPVQMPCRATPEEFSWIDIPMDQIA